MSEKIEKLLEEQNAILKRQDEFNNELMRKFDDALRMLALAAAHASRGASATDKNRAFLEQYMKQKFWRNEDL